MFPRETGKDLRPIAQKRNVSGSAGGEPLLQMEGDRPRDAGAGLHQLSFS